jgi:hypothetical protein
MGVTVNNVRSRKDAIPGWSTTAFFDPHGTGRRFGSAEQRGNAAFLD